VAEQSLAAAGAPDRATVEAVWRRRAERLARPPVTEETALTPVLVFRLGEERYALAVAALAEVIPAGRLARVPRAPAALAGVVALRGEVRPVWDLARLLGLSRPAPSIHYILLLNSRAGLLVDQLEEIRLLRCDAVTPDLVTLLDPDALRKQMEAA